MKNTFAYALFLIAFASSGLAQTPGDQAVLGNSSSRPSVVSGTGSSTSLHELTLRLNSSFQSVAQARDPKGFVQNRAVLKEHTANLKAFRKALKRKGGSAADTTDGQLQNISRLLHDTTEYFFAFEEANDQPNNPNIVVTMDVRESFAAHQASLKRLTEAVGQGGSSAGGT